MNALRILLGSVGTALAHPRVVLTAWLVVTAAALCAVWPVYLQLDAALGGHPGATRNLDLALDADFARLHPEAAVALAGGSFAVLLAFAFLAGGILASVGTGGKFTYTGFLLNGARLFARNLRVLLLGVPVCALLFWGVGWLDRRIREHWVYEWDTGPLSVFGLQTRWLSLEMGLEALSWLWGFLFVGVVFASKMAMARLVERDRRSALWAWWWSIGRVLRHPLRTGALVVLWAVLLLGVAHGFGVLTGRFLEVEGELGLALLSGQLGILWVQVAVVAAFVAARRLACPEGAPAARAPEGATPAPPFEVIGRRGDEPHPHDPSKP